MHTLTSHHSSDSVAVDDGEQVQVLWLDPVVPVFPAQHLEVFLAHVRGLQVGNEAAQDAGQEQGGVLLQGQAELKHEK
jgi:hypothetical protein